MELRYPGDHGIPDSANHRITEQYFPRPSLSGVSFAILAATLPLLRGKSSQLLLPLQELIATVAPYVIEHSENEHMLSALDKNDENHIFSLNTKRLQHVLSRIDQVL